MLQVLQSLKDGKTEIAEVPAPANSSGNLLIRTERTLISAGTEKMLVEFGQAGWIGKAKSQPDKVKQVLDKIKTDGLLPTLDAVFSKLGEPLPLGYCNVGTVIEVGQDVRGFQVGDRVISNGPHASFVSVPQNLCAKVPDSLDSEEAAFTVLASIGLQGLRLAEPTLGECVVVYGLGLIGLITVQLLRANGCQVIGIDINDQRLRLAESFGAIPIDAKTCNNIPETVRSITNNRGADAVIITASAKTDEIVSIAANSCRKRGRVVLVGVVGLNLRRTDFYEKELTFRVSCSYGPGRYDEQYEQFGVDYPVAFVRWTEQRNFEAILQMLESKLINFSPLITHRYAINDGADAYATIQNDASALGVLLQFPCDTGYTQSIDISPTPSSSNNRKEKQLVTAIIGAGNFTRATLVPALKHLPYHVKYVVGRNSTSNIRYTAEKIGAKQATTDWESVLNDSETNLLVITTNHDSHARFVCQGLANGKHVFVEKPLAMTRDELSRIDEARLKAPELNVVVGFNRRFSPHTAKCVELLRGRSAPIAVQILVNAGDIPANHWVHDKQLGGGRIIGEACHFIDLASFFAGSPIISVNSMQMGGDVLIPDDKMSINVSMADGSVGNICYFANGSKSYPKELIRIFSDNRVLEIVNFRTTIGYGFNRFKKLKTSRQEKGHTQQFSEVHRTLTGESNDTFDYSSYLNTTLASIAAVESAATGNSIAI